MQNAETILGSINHRRAACGESLQARFGGGPTEKARATGTSPAAYPTRETTIVLSSCGRSYRLTVTQKLTP